MYKRMIITATLFLAIAVMLGALGAHALKASLTPDKLESFKTGVTYQFYHGFAILLMALLGKIFDKPSLKISAYLFAAGIIMFSGSIYLLSATSLVQDYPVMKPMGIITPAGGILFIAGWIYALIAFLKK